MSAANWNIPPPTYDAHSTTTSYFTTTLTPYLQLPHLLSLTWLAYPILSLVFVAFRLQLSLTDAQNAAVSAKSDLLASCKAAEEAATSAASMPRFLALATNRQFADAINGSMNAARAALVLSLTVMEAIINFIVDIYRSTFLCFLELVVRGGLAILIGAVDEINQVLQSVTSSLRTGIQNDIASANSVIQKAIDTVNKVNPFGDITAPQITVPSLDSLQNVSLPSSFEDALTKLNASIPSVSDIKDKVDGIIDTPFELLKKDINDTFAGLSFSPDGMPVPELNRLSFCNDLDTSVIDDINRDFIKTFKIGVVILILLALLLVGLNCLLTWCKWRCMKNHLEYTRQAWVTDPTMVHTKSSSVSSSPQIALSDHNLMMLQANSEHPLITRITNQLSHRLHLSPSQHTHIQWFFNYIFHAPALACLLIGFFGLLSVEVQLLAMKPLVAKYQARSASAVSDFSVTIASSINSSMYNQSSLYATQVNGQVDVIQNTINDGVFGWVNGTTTTLNSTINEFYTDIQNAVTTVFGGTILESPAEDFIKCFIGSKVDAIESALTFLHDNLIVDMPRVNETVLILSPDSVNEATRPIAAAAIGGGDGDDGGLIGRLVNTYANSLKKERVMFGIFIALWGFVVLMGIGIVLWHSYGRAYLEKRGRRKYQQEQRGAGMEAISPYVVNAADAKRGGSFDELPEARRSVFRPFWASNTNLNSPSASQESVVRDAPSNTVADDRPWETAFAQPTERKPTTGSKLLAIGRKAIRGERFKTDKAAADEEQVQDVPLTPAPVSDPVASNSRNTAWFGKMAGVLAKKSTTTKESDGESVDFWEQNDSASAAPAVAVTNANEMQEKPKPKLQVYTQRALSKYRPSPKQDVEQQEQQRSRWSASPDATQTSWKNIMSPTKKQPQQTPTVVVSQEPETTYAAFPYPPIGIPIRKPRQYTTDVPLDVGPVYEDPFMNPPTATKNQQMPMPLYNGFDSQPQYPQHQRQRSYPSPPRHPKLKQQDSSITSSPPPPLKSPRLGHYQTSLAPPPREQQHKRSSSAGTSVSQWRVTNAAPGDSPSSTSSSLAVPSSTGRNNSGSSGELLTPVTRLLTTTHARQSSSVNPFITPFDDEHRVQIDHPSEAGMRKSMQTNPFAVAM